MQPWLCGWMKIDANDDRIGRDVLYLGILRGLLRPVPENNAPLLQFITIHPRPQRLGIMKYRNVTYINNQTALGPPSCSRHMKQMGFCASSKSAI